MDSILYTESPLIPPVYRHGNSDILPAWSQREAAAAEQPWTATRCHRQLRPLLAHLTALRREKAIAALKKKNDDSRCLPNAKKRRPCDNDPADRKRVRYTYSLKGTGRRRHRQPDAPPSAFHATPDRPTKEERTKHVPAKQQSQRSFSPGEIVLATPMLSRARKSKQLQCLPSSPLTYATDAATMRNTHSARRKADNPMSSRYGCYRSLSRVGGNAAAKTPANEEWAILAKETPAEYHALHEAVFRAFDSILRATAEAREPASKANSLLAMCLRKVPQFISMCDEASRKEAECKEKGSSSISLDVYNDLESFGRAGSGWKHLRGVLREHAVHILTEACAEGLFHAAFIRLLARLCINMKAYAEAEAFMAALFDMHILTVPAGQSLFRPPTDASSGIPDSTGAPSSLSLLIQYSGEMGRTSAPLRQITRLLEGGHLPPAWLSTQAFTSVWHRVARLLSSRGTAACDEAALVDFVVAAMARLVRSNPADDIDSQNLHATPVRCDGAASALSASSSYHALVSILGTMCAICILQREALSGGDGARPVREPSVVIRLSSIVHCCLAEVGRKPRRQKGRSSVADEAFLAPRRYLLKLALCVLGLGCGGAQADVPNISRSDGAVKGQLYDVTVAFAASVAENCGRGSKSSDLSMPDARDYLRSICLPLSKLLGGVADWESDKDLSRPLLADSAFLLASRSNDLRDLAFAESLGKTLKRAASRTCISEPGSRPAMPASAKTSATPISGARAGLAASGLFEGYRWEEGISEWVISTPGSASSNSSLDVLPAEVVACPYEDDEAATMASTNLKPDLLRTPVPYLTPSPSMRASSNTGDVFDDDESDYGEGEANDDRGSEQAASSPELPARTKTSRPPRTTWRSLPSSDFGPDSDWMPKTTRKAWIMRTRQASRAARQPQPAHQPRQSLLDLVSDDGVDDVFEEGSCSSSATSTAPARTPLLLSLGGTARRSVGTGHLIKPGPLGKMKHREKTLAAAVASSDDELGL